MSRARTYRTTAEAAKLIGVAKSTLLRWIHQGIVADVAKDRRGWRRFSPQDVDRLRRFNEGESDLGTKRP